MAGWCCCGAPRTVPVALPLASGGMMSAHVAAKTGTAAAPLPLLLSLGLLAAQATGAGTVDVVGQLRQRRCNFDVWDVADRGPLSPEEFQRRYPAGVPRAAEQLKGSWGRRKALGPLIVKGGAAELAAVSGPQQWTADHLAQVAGGVKMEALEHTKDTARGLYHYARGGPTREVTLAEFLATKGVNATGYGDDYIFQRTHFMEPEWNGLDAEFSVPEWSGAPIRSQEVFFAIGPVGSGLAFHKHGEAWNLVASGAKWWVLFPPGEFDKMEQGARQSGLKIRNAGEDGALMAAWLDGRSSSAAGAAGDAGAAEEFQGNPACFSAESGYTAARCCDTSSSVQGDASCWGDGFSFSRCCTAQGQGGGGGGGGRGPPSAAAAAAAAAAGGSSSDYPDGFERGYECVQEAGDLVFVPRNWYHAVVNLEDNTVAIAGQPSPNILGFDGGVKKKQNQKDSTATAADAPAPAPAAAAGFSTAAAAAAAGGVTEADFLSMYASHGLNLKEQRAMFDRYDLDKDGVLNPHEMGFVKLRLGEV